MRYAVASAPQSRNSERETNKKGPLSCTQEVDMSLSPKTESWMNEKIVRFYFEVFQQTRKQGISEAERLLV